MPPGTRRAPLPPHNAYNEKMTTADSLANHFLIAMPGMQDEQFAQTITYLCQHDEDGAMGVVINVPTDMRLNEIFEQLSIEGGFRGRDLVMAGGPVHSDRGFVLHNDGGFWQSTLAVTPQIHLTTSRDILEAIAAGHGPQHHLVAVGSAGWGPGQLETELAANAWLTCPASQEILFNTAYDERLPRALKSMGIDLARLSTQAGHA